MVYINIGTIFKQIANITRVSLVLTQAFVLIFF